MSQWSQTAVKWSRLLHVVVTMLGLLVLLLFAGTGLVLNHPSWTAGISVQRQEASGTVPPEQRVSDLHLEEYLRGHYQLRGRAEVVRAADYVEVAWRAPGYAADAKVELATGVVTLIVENQGLVAVVLDLHRGRQAGPVWGWVVDITAVGLLLAGLTGVIMTFWSVRWRNVGLWSAGVGVVLVLGLVAWAYWGG